MQIANRAVVAAKLSSPRGWQLDMCQLRMQLRADRPGLSDSEISGLHHHATDVVRGELSGCQMMGHVKS